MKISLFLSAVPITIAFMLPPMVISYNSSLTGFLLSITAIIFLISALGSKFKFNHVDFALRGFLILTLYCSFYLVLSDSKSAIYTYVISVSYLMLCGSFFSVNLHRVHSTTKWILRIVLSANVVTLILTGGSVELFKQYEIFSLPITGRGEMESINFLFQFSTIPYVMTVQDRIIPRSTYLSIEPGVAVFIPLLWRVLEGRSRGLINSFKNILFILLELLTVSTTALLIIPIYFVYTYLYDGGPIFSQKKLLTLSGYLILMLALFMFMPYFGFLSKNVTHGSSFEERILYYAGEGAVLRWITALLVVLHYLLVRKFLRTDYGILHIGLFVTSVLNVVEFTPLYFIASYLALKNGKSSAFEARVETQS